MNTTKYINFYKEHIKVLEKVINYFENNEVKIFGPKTFEKIQKEIGVYIVRGDKRYDWEQENIKYMYEYIGYNS